MQTILFRKFAAAAALILLFGAACVSVVPTGPVDARLVEAQNAAEQGQRLEGTGSYAQAKLLYERALALRQEALGQYHPDVATLLNRLTMLYWAQKNYTRAEPLCERALVIREKTLGPNHPDVATSLNNLASLYWAQGKYAQAEPLCERALAIREKTLGPNHPDVATAINNLAALYWSQGNHAQAEPLYERALAIQEAALGPNHPDVAVSLDSLATRYWSQGNYAQAEPLYERALAIQEAALGPNHPDVATAINNLAALYWAQRKYIQAEPLYERALAIQEAALGPNHPDVAESLNSLATLYWAQGKYIQAKPLHERALAIQEAVLGPDHPVVATSLYNLAKLHQSQSNYAQAEPLYERALAIQEAVLGPNHPDVAIPLNNLANLHQSQSNHAQAEPLYERALAIQEAVLGPDHPAVATSLNNLATLHQRQGNYVQAKSIFERALAIQEAVLGPDHPAVATSLTNLASTYQDQGNYGQAKPLYERALAIQQVAFGQNHPDVATSLTNLAILYWTQGNYAQAEPLYERALAIREVALGPNHPDVATAINNLATLYWSQGNYAQAEPLYERALAIQEAALGQNHPDVATSLNNLASLYQAQGHYAQAGPLYERALAIQEAALGQNHPDVAISLNNLALSYVTQRHLKSALPLFARAFAISEKHLRQEIFGLSETHVARALSLLRSKEDLLYRLVRAYPDDSRVRDLALAATLLRKGRSVEELAGISRIIYRSLEQADREKFEYLRSLHAQYATLSLSSPGLRSLVGYQQRIEEIKKQSNDLEADLAKRSAPLRALSALPTPSEITDRIAASLPKGGVLVELVAYHGGPLDFAPGSAPLKQPSELRYLALLLFPDGRTSAIDLGPAAPIDHAAQRLRDVLANPDSDYQHAAQTLYQLAFHPLVPLLGEVRRLFLSPEGQLALIPFVALHDGHRFLVDDFDITYLTSGKDLLARPDGIPPAHSVVVLADPDFSSRPATPPSTEKVVPDERFTSLERLFASLRTELDGYFWPALPGTRKEAEAIRRLLPQATILLGSAATKAALLKLDAPGVLHIATHGFFREDSAAPVDGASLVAMRDVKSSVGDTGPQQALPDPLLRSGLVLAGAYASGEQTSPLRREETLVTALELAGLNLWGTQLVVLSACDTGRGDIQLGQGVYGLRRALVIAGAETLVTSLWRVNDSTTWELMQDYYSGLLVGRGRATALREAMLAMRAKRPHPYFWAPFIAIGQDSPLMHVEPHSETDKTQR